MGPVPAGQQLLAHRLSALERWRAGGEVATLPRLYRDDDPTTAAGMEDRVGEVGYAVCPHALGELEGLPLGLGDLGGARAVPDARGWRKTLAVLVGLLKR
jgi:hypothetical protein